MTKTIKLGQQGPEVFPFALGCMSMGERGWYGPSDETENIATIHAALERGVNIIDTGDFYSWGRNELLVGKALRGARRDKAVVSVKFGAQVAPDGSFVGFDTSPAAIKNSLGYSLTRLGVDYIDIYRPARLDPKTPIEETMGVLADCVKKGWIRHISLSEVGADTIRRAAKVAPVADLQIEYSLISRSPEAKIFPALAELGIGVTAYGVLSRGLLTGSKVTNPSDYRAHSPRFEGENGEKNQALATALQSMAKERNVSAAALAIAWVRAKAAAAGVTLVPLLGARTRAQLTESLGGLSATLSAADLATIEAAMPTAAGERYNAHQMAALDSER